MYQICRRLGGGGEGDVYLVRHLPTEQLRAAKIIKSEDPHRQLHELNMMKHLHHPALPQILDVFQWEGQVWLIMEYIRGRTLSEAQGRAMTGEQFFQIARELAEVLIYLHSRDNPVLHLDIKPTNIIVKRDSHLALVDFGASVLYRSGRNTGNRFGTRGFAAPEQLEGPGADIDGRADIYGFGATMYYCLYGKTPGTCTEMGRRCAVPDYCLSGKRPEACTEMGRRCAAPDYCLSRQPSAAFAGQAEKGRRRRDCKRRWGRIGRTEYWRKQAAIIVEKCMQADRSRRYPDFRTLYREICRAGKKCRQRKRMRGITAAAGFFLLAVLFAVGVWPRPDIDEASPENGQRYGQLLEMASGMGLAQAGALYEEAVQLQPDGDWGLILLERFTEDYLFTAEEEALLNGLIYKGVAGTGQTVAERMRQQPGIYGEFSYQLGLAYWYFYQESGGKRAAARWFAQAIRSQQGQEQPAGWLEAARIHADIGDYYEKLGRQDEEGRRQADFQTYWGDLKRLWQLDSLQGESAGVRRQVAFELLSCLIMGAYEIRQSGEDRETIEQILSRLAEFTQDEQIWPEEEQREAATELYRDAVAAVERAFADERGKEFEGEQESAE